MERAIIHMILHFLVPAVAAKMVYPRRFMFAYIVMMATMLVDLDHLFANPVYDPNRCSIGTHFLHSYWLVPIYLAFCFIPKLRLIGLGLIIHMLLDGIDCIWMSFV